MSRHTLFQLPDAGAPSRGPAVEGGHPAKARAGRCRTAVRATVGAAAMIGSLVSPSSARAQSTDGAARAEALFNAAKQLRDAGQYADACSNFAESKRLAPGVGITLYLADCYEREGKTARAWKEFLDAEKLARERSDPRAEVASARAAALQPRLIGLTLVVPSAASHEAPEVALDGVPIPSDEWNLAMAVDPGDHVVTVNARGKPARTIPVHLDAGSRGTSVLVGDVETPAAATPAPSAPAPVESPAPAPSGPGSSRMILGLSLVAVGLAGIGIGSGFLLKYESTANPPPSCSPTPKDTESEVASGVAFGLGGVALVSAVAALLTAPHGETSAVLVTPVPLTGGAGALLRARF